MTAEPGSCRASERKAGDAASQLWVITTYFNPAGYGSRLVNFRRFRKQFACRLLAVEMACDGRFALNADDADILVRVCGGAALWQKERLLNIAVSKLPPEAKYVAWMDCDLAFSNPRWAEETVALLARHPLVQLFNYLVDMQPDGAAPCEAAIPTGCGIAWSSRRSRSAYAVWSMFKFLWRRLSMVLDRPFRIDHFGFAWAAERAFLERHGFYDALVVGGGDQALIGAAYGDFDVVCKSKCLSATRFRHYLAWAEPVFAEIKGNVGFLRNTAFHFWHGEIADRRYRERHSELAGYDFDPFQDIAIGPDGCWVWASDKPAMHAYVRRYFDMRREDG